MSDMIQYRHPVTNRVKRSDNPEYMQLNGFEVFEGEVEVDKANVEFAALSLDDLRAIAKEAGLPVSGSKADLQERIAEHAASQNADTDSGAGSDPSSAPAGGDK